MDADGPSNAQVEAQKNNMVLEEVDRLQLENAQLKLMNLSGQRQAMLLELERLEVMGAKAQATYMAKLAELQEKYGFDPSTHEMEPGTGVIRPRGETKKAPIG
jgi:hypothetical protein